VEGDDHGEAYTAILRGVGLSHERNNVAGAEALVDVEGNMCGTATRGSAALPGSGGHITQERTASEPGRPHLHPQPRRRLRAATGSRGDEAVEEEVRSRTAV
jgi:hypothetical protein